MTLLKMPYKNSCVKFDAFSRQNGLFIFPQNEGAQKKIVAGNNESSAYNIAYKLTVIHRKLSFTAYNSVYTYEIMR